MEMDHQGIQELDGAIVNDKYIRLLPNIEFSVVGDISLKVNVMMPRQSPKKENNTIDPKPLIIYFQGSGWGYMPLYTFQFLPQLVEFVKRGYVVASAQYRLSNEAKFPAQIHDAKAAVRFFRAHAKKYHIDPNKIGVWGDSSGGHLASLLGTSAEVADLEGNGGNEEQSSRVQAVVDWYGPTDLVQMSKSPSTIDHDAPNSPESMLIGEAIQENKEKTDKANPIRYITPNVPPFLIMHGDEDDIVPYNQSELLYDALKKIKADVTMYKNKGAGHGTGFVQPHILKEVHDFFDRHLK